MSGTPKIRSLFRSLTKYWPAGVLKWLSCSQRLRQSCKHSWFVPRVQNSAYCHRIELFFFSAHLIYVCVCVCVCDMGCLQILQQCVTLHFSITDPHHSSSFLMAVCVCVCGVDAQYSPYSAAWEGCDLWCLNTLDPDLKWDPGCCVVVPHMPTVITTREGTCPLGENVWDFCMKLLVFYRKKRSLLCELMCIYVYHWVVFVWRR